MDNRVKTPVALACGLAVLSAAPAASAQGITARFGDLVATIGEDVVARIEVTDPRRITKRVAVQLRRGDELEWQTIDAAPAMAGSFWWTGTFTSTTVWNEGGIRVKQPERIQVRAILYGARGGILLVIGEIEPLEVDVLSAPETEARNRALSRYDRADDDEEDLLTLTGYVGTEGRAGSSARARAFIGVGGSLSRNLELLVYVGVGPEFAAPAALEAGGPLVLGFDLALRVFARPPFLYSWSPFVEPFATVDLRFPGLDPGGGARAGVLFPVSPEIALEISIGGAVMIFNVAAAAGNEVEVGGSGMLRAAVRFGGASEPS